MHLLRWLARLIGQTFALWALLFAVLGYLFPASFTPLKGTIQYALGLVMFGMGLTLKPADFAEIARRPWQVAAGVGAQFLVMPLLAFGLTVAFSLDPYIALGIILVGCCPGGTSSNVITYLAKGDVALSVTITTVTTLLAPLVTPLLLDLYAGQIIAIELTVMMIGIAKLVLLPVIAGVTIHYLLKERLDHIIELLPIVSVSGIVFIVAVVVALSQARIAEAGLLIFAVVVLHNLGGYAIGALIGRLMGFGRAQRRTLMIEVGMQNSGLGATLAALNFAAHPIAALPSAMFSVWHNISGALLANLCGLLDRQRAAADN